jgi:hypothetical protein
MSAGAVKRISLFVHVGKAGDKSVDKRDFLCTKQWINCGYLSVSFNKSLKVQVSSVTSPYMLCMKVNNFFSLVEMTPQIYFSARGFLT